MAERSRRLAPRRRIIQLAFAVLSNSFVTGFAAGRIYQGDLKRLCAPGLNCYSCPGALLSCPIGSLQAVLGARGFHVSLYVFGLVLLFGALLGRMVCGFLCPFGMVQEWLHRIPFPWRIRKDFRGDRALRRLKYAVLLILVIGLPMALKGGGTGSPAFCKYVCPAGTLEGGVPLVLLSGAASAAPAPGPFQALPGFADAAARPVYQTGWLFGWKLALLALTLLASVLIYRPFCKYLCPLGAIYGLLNPVALYRLNMSEAACIHCGKCRRACQMALDPEHRRNEAECVRCGDCVDACPMGALSMGFTPRPSRTGPGRAVPQ